MESDMNEPKISGIYSRSPYAQRLEKIGFKMVVCPKIQNNLTEYARTAFKPLEQAALIWLCVRLKDAAKRRTKHYPVFCFVSNDHLQGVFIRDLNGNAWYRNEFWSPDSDDASLDFVDVTSETEKKRYLPKPE
jgi:hypothetical protein